MAVRTVNGAYSIFPEQDKFLRQLAEEKKAPVSELVREAIDLLKKKYRLKTA